MQEKDLVRLLEPIKNYIKNNPVEEYDVPKIVQHFFPTGKDFEEVSKFIQKNMPDLMFVPEKQVAEHVRQVLKKALEDGAYAVLDEKHSSEYYKQEKPNPYIKNIRKKFTDDEIKEELGNYEWNDDGFDEDR